MTVIDPRKEDSYVIPLFNEVETIADAQTAFPNRAVRFVFPPLGTTDEIKMVYRASDGGTHNFPSQDYVDVEVAAVQQQVDTISGNISNFVDTNDPRLSDDRDPNPHTHAIADVTGLAQDLADKVDTTDSRLSDDRNPLAHTHDIADVTNLQDALDDKLERADLVGEIELADLKSEVTDKLLPPNAFFVSTEAELLTALAYDGERVITVTKRTIVTTPTITVGDGRCRVFGGQFKLGAPMITFGAYAGTTPTTFTAVDPWRLEFSCLIEFYQDVICDNTNIAVTSITGTFSVTATTGSFTYETSLGTIGGDAVQGYWSNTYEPQPQSIGTTELTPAVVNRLNPTSTAFVSTVLQFLSALSDAAIKEIRVTEHITATSQALEINGDKQIYGTLTIDGTTTTSGDGYPHFNDPLTLGGTLTTVKKWRMTRVSGTVTVTGDLEYEWTDGTVTGGVQEFWRNTNTGSGGGGGDPVIVQWKSGDPTVSQPLGYSGKLGTSDGGRWRICQINAESFACIFKFSGGKNRTGQYDRALDFEVSYYITKSKTFGTVVRLSGYSRNVQNAQTDGANARTTFVADPFSITPRIGINNNDATISLSFPFPVNGAASSTYNTKQVEASVAFLERPEGVAVEDLVQWHFEGDPTNQTRTATTPYAYNENIRVAYDRQSLVNAFSMRPFVKDSYGYAVVRDNNIQNNTIFIYYSSPMSYPATASITLTLVDNTKYIVFGENFIVQNYPLYITGGNENTEVLFMNRSMTINTATGLNLNGFNGKVFVKTIISNTVNTTITNGAGKFFYEEFITTTGKTPPVNATQQFWDNTYASFATPRLLPTSPTSGDTVKWDGSKWITTTGATGSFTDPDGNTVTVTNGLITAITPP